MAGASLLLHRLEPLHPGRRALPLLLTLLITRGAVVVLEAAIRAAGADAVVVEGLTTARDLAERAVLLYETSADAASPS